MRNDLSGVFRADQAAVKTAFLSYYISMYNAVNKEIGYSSSTVTIDEIYDFIQDLKHEAGMEVPDIRKEDISFCFHLLKVSGICRP
jgi:transcriptional regulatory protein LevR